MRRFLTAAFLLLWSLPAQAIILSGSVVTPSPPTCPYGSALDDGCAAAPTNGFFQDAAYFTTYSITAHRPSWNVAGVDYPVGYPTNTVFKDPAVDSLPSGFVYSADSKWIRCDATNNGTLDGWDFSLHSGIQVFMVGCSGWTITNSKFGGSNYKALSVGPVQLDAASVGLDFEHNYLDGGCTTPGEATNQATLVSTGAATGTYTLKYNWFGNYCQQIVEANGSTWTVKYNFIDNGNISSGSHQNYMQWGSGTVDVAWDFNTTRQTTLGGAEGPQFYFNGVGTIHSPDVSNNTMVAIKSSGTNTMSNMIHGSAIGTGTTTLTGTATAGQNYMDFAGANAAFYPGSFTAWTAPSANIDMTTGSTITFP